MLDSSVGLDLTRFNLCDFCVNLNKNSCCKYNEYMKNSIIYNVQLDKVYSCCKFEGKIYIDKIQNVEYTDMQSIEAVKNSYFKNEYDINFNVKRSGKRFDKFISELNWLLAIYEYKHLLIFCIILLIIYPALYCLFLL